MGSENLFHKRKAHKAELHRRRMAKRAPYDRVLIVCEGAKTEPNYFGWLRNKLGLNRANVVTRANWRPWRSWKNKQISCFTPAIRQPLLSWDS
jgi:hypothetical protein